MVEPLSLPPIPSPKTAFVYLHAQSGGDFFADVPFAWTAGELRRLGLGADLFHVWLEREQPARSQGLLDELISALSTGSYSLVVFEHLWQPALLRRLQTELGCLVCVTGAFAGQEDARVDFRLAHFDQHRQPLIDLLLILQAGGDLLSLPNLRVHLTQMPAPRDSLVPREPHPAQPDALRPFCPIVDAQHIGEALDAQGQRPPVRKSLDTNSGCPYAADVRENPSFAGVELDAERLDGLKGLELHNLGCAFCPMGGDYRSLSAQQTVELHLDQIAWYQRHLPVLDEVVLRDQHALRYLPALIEGALRRELRPFGLLVPGRGDAILRFGDEMRQAAAIAEDSEMWFCIYLVGFESFSQAQLDLYNKGVRVSQYAEALANMRALHARYPESFRLYAYAASSFILFNPWTELRDLEETATFCNTHAVGALSHGLLRSRLRLYPQLPLYWKAHAEGLLLTPTTGETSEAAFSGYGLDHPWRFRDGRLATLEALLRALQPLVRTDEEVGLLSAALRHARRTMPEPLPATAEIDDERREEIERLRAEVQALRSLWRSRQRKRPRERERPRQPETEAPQKTGAPPALGEHLAEERALRHAPVRQRAERLVLLGEGCNNHCRACVAGHAVHGIELRRLLVQVEAAAAHGEVVLAGREPTLLPALPRLIRAARAAGAKRIEVVSNGRALAIAGVGGRLQRAGMTHLLLKRHRLRDDDEDAYSRAPGAGAQLWRALNQLRREAPEVVISLLLIATAEGHQELPALVQRAAELGLRNVQLKVMAAELALEAPEAMTESLRAAVAVAKREEMNCGIEGF